MAEPFACEKYLDGSWWETIVPDGWDVKRDQSIMGWPYVFSSAEASLVIHSHFTDASVSDSGAVSSNCAWIVLPEYAWIVFPLDAQNSVEKEMYCTAARDLAFSPDWRSRNSDAASDLQKQIVRYDLGQLSGYGYIHEPGGERTWRACLGHAPLVLRAGFTCHGEGYDEQFQVGLRTISSIRFFSMSEKLASTGAAKLKERFGLQ